MKVFTKLLACVVATTTISVFAQAQQDEPTRGNERQQLDKMRQETEEARVQMDAAIKALAELEGERVVNQFIPLLNQMQPYIDSITDVMVDTLASVGEAIQLQSVGALFSKDSKNGLEIVLVEPWSPAGHAGLQAEDVVVSVDGIDITKANEPQEIVQRLTSGTEPGETTTFGILRDGESMDIELDLSAAGTFTTIIERLGSGNWDAVQQYTLLNEWERRGNSRFFGGYATRAKQVSLMEVEGDLGQYFGVEFGVLVLEVPEEHEVLKPGDILLRIGENSVRSFSHAQRYFNQRQNGSISAPTELTVRRRGRQQELKIDTDEDTWVFVQGYSKQ